MKVWQSLATLVLDMEIFSRNSSPLSSITFLQRDRSWHTESQSLPCHNIFWKQRQINTRIGSPVIEEPGTPNLSKEEGAWVELRYDKQVVTTTADCDTSQTSKRAPEILRSQVFKNSPEIFLTSHQPNSVHFFEYLKNQHKMSPCIYLCNCSITFSVNCMSLHYGLMI